MKKAGQVVVIKFPQTDYQGNKLRPALLIAPLPGKYGDWLVCMDFRKCPMNFNAI